MKLAKNSLYSLGAALLPLVVSVVTVPLYVSKIGAERYGALAIAWILLGYFGQADFGIGRAITQRIAAMRDASKEDRAQAIWAALAGMMVLGLFSAVVMFFCARYFFAGPFKIDETMRGELMDSVLLLALCNPVVSLIGVLSGALIGVERFKLVSLSNLLSNSALQIFPVLYAYFVDISLNHLILAALLGRMVGLVMLSLGVWFTFLRGRFMAPRFNEFKTLMNFGAWIMLTSLISPLMVFGDRFVIGDIYGAVAVAAYTIPFQMASRALFFPAAVMQALFPRLAAESDEKSLERSRQYSVFIGQIFAPVVLGAICLSGPLLHLWLGSKLDPRSVQVAQIVFAGIWTNAVALVPYSYIQARGNPRYTAMLHTIELPIYMGMLYVLGLQFGLSGIAVAFALRCALDGVLLMRKSNIWDRYTLGRLAAPTALILLATIGGGEARTWGMALLMAVIFCGAATIALLLQMPSDIRVRIMTLPLTRFIPGLHRAK